MRNRRLWLGFGLGVVATAIILPLLAVLWLRLFWGVDATRTSAPAPFSQPDISVSVSRVYLEQLITNNEAFKNPVVELAPLASGGATLTLTVGFQFPLLGMQDTRSVSDITTVGGKLVVATRQVGLGPDGRLGVPGSLVESMLSTLLTEEINRRLDSAPGMPLDIVRVSAARDGELLTIDAALRRPGN